MTNTKQLFEEVVKNAMDAIVTLDNVDKAKNYTHLALALAIKDFAEKELESDEKFDDAALSFALGVVPLFKGEDSDEMEEVNFEVFDEGNPFVDNPFENIPNRNNEEDDEEEPFLASDIIDNSLDETEETVETIEELVAEEQIVTSEETTADQWTEETYEKYNNELSYINGLIEEYGLDIIEEQVEEFSSGVGADMSFISPLNVVAFYAYLKELMDQAQEEE